MTQHLTTVLVSIALLPTLACDRPSAPSPGKEPTQEASWSRDLVLTKLETQGWKIQHLKTTTPQTPQGPASESFILSKEGVTGGLELMTFPTPELARAYLDASDSFKLPDTAWVQQGAHVFQATLVSQALPAPKQAASLLTTLTGEEIFRRPTPATKMPRPLSEPTTLTALKDATEVPWTQPITLAWRFQEPLLYETTQNAQMLVNGEPKSEKTQAMLAFKPHTEGAIMSYTPKGRGPKLTATINIYGDKLAESRGELVNLVLPSLFPTSRDKLDPKGTLTHEIHSPLKVGEIDGKLSGKARTKLRRAVKSGERTLLELEVDIDLSELEGPELIQKMKGSALKGQALVYYEPKTQRFALGSANITSTLNYKDTPMGELIEAMYGSSTAVVNMRYDYTLAKGP